MLSSVGFWCFCLSAFSTIAPFFLLDFPSIHTSIDKSLDKYYHFTMEETKFAYPAHNSCLFARFLTIPITKGEGIYAEHRRLR